MQHDRFGGLGLGEMPASLTDIQPRAPSYPLLIGTQALEMRLQARLLLWQGGRRSYMTDDFSCSRLR